MPARTPRKSARPRREWLVRSAIALLIAIAGYLCVTYSFAQVLRDRQPQLALSLAPRDGRALARLGFDQFMQRPIADSDAGPIRLAREALAADPTAVSAAVTLGLNADLRRDPATAKRMFAYAQQLTRRDLSTQIWAIEDAVTRGDVTRALRHYDIALRTKRAAPQILFPVMTTALDEPQIRAGLVRTLAGAPAWKAAFIAHAIANSASPASLVALFDAMRASRVAVAPEASASLVNRLVLFSAYEPAWRYYSSLRPGADRRRSRNPRFATDVSNPAPFDWNVTNSSEASGALQASEQGGTLSFSIPPNGGGVMATQLQLLPPGAYRLTGRSSRITQDVRALPYWTLKCRDGRELLRVPLSGFSSAGTAFGATVVVPANCPVQMLTLVGQSSERIGGTEGQVDAVALVPAGRFN